ncbi:probable DNA replication complex GINS protein PSF2 isoform X2 [Cylas formicarius]|uniref:probable DNA replication complex GINS protein PSF2 isoform X2 n=1 Tax=Cylas formicarius TaxID=197179 RepID=UPI002958569D|nr:probable DNA replication complex GINS protein PSF2 isoform X2 [Cylas formicarius]
MVRALLCLKIGYMNVFLLNEMDPDEVEFFGEKSQISIVPSFNSATIHLISGDVGPFRAGIPTTVPLWLAVNLKRQQQCKIQSPDWMRLEELERIKNDEKESRTFTSMPENYIVEAKLILGCASDDIPKADEVRTMIKDIWDIRTSKLRSSVDSLIKKTTIVRKV